MAKTLELQAETADYRYRKTRNRIRTQGSAWRILSKLSPVYPGITRETEGIRSVRRSLRIALSPSGGKRGKGYDFGSKFTGANRGTVRISQGHDAWPDDRVDCKELNESLCCVIINASTCLHMLAADPPNVEGARETARRSIRDSNRAAQAVSRLSALFYGKEAESCSRRLRS